ncbi:MAG: GMC family oxidoreductase [Myxococcales bacterium]|nr:GMC family oxidoreductase [Myxococcales bacterium]
MAIRDETDVVVIGSGAGGAPAAFHLSRAGARVVVLERGNYYTIRDFTHDEVGVCLRDMFVPHPARHPHTIVKDGERRERTREGWIGVCVGGGTVHMSGYVYRLHPEDFRMRTLFGAVPDAQLADWPICYADLAPWYDRVDTLMGTTGRAGANPFEPPRRPYPLPPLLPHPVVKVLDPAARGLGFHPYPTPRLVLSRPYGGRPGCTYCGFCVEFGCENGSKSSVLATLLPEAEATGHCLIRSRAQARRILVDDEARVRGVEYVDARGTVRFIGARVVILAASAVESARILLLSANSRFPRGLANGSGLVGKNLMFSTFGKATAIFDRKEMIAALGRERMDFPFVQRSIQDDYLNDKAGFPFPKGGTYNFLGQLPYPISATLRLSMDEGWRLFGAPLREAVRRYFHDELWVEAETFGEFLPWEGCRVELDPEVKDEFDLPVACIHLKHHPLDVEVNKRMVRRAMDILEAVNPRAKKVTPWSWGQTTFHVQQGTIRFGTDPASSVLGPDCQAHEVKNLYVTDGSFMPTSGGVPSTLTILANSLRVANTIAERFQRHEI